VDQIIGRIDAGESRLEVEEIMEVTANRLITITGIRVLQMERSAAKGDDLMIGMVQEMVDEGTTDKSRSTNDRNLHREILILSARRMSWTKL
jgi:hypothetical protein